MFLPRNFLISPLNRIGAFAAPKGTTFAGASRGWRSISVRKLLEKMKTSSAAKNNFLRDTTRGARPLAGQEPSPGFSLRRLALLEPVLFLALLMLTYFDRVYSRARALPEETKRNASRGEQKKTGTFHVLKKKSHFPSHAEQTTKTFPHVEALIGFSPRRSLCPGVLSFPLLTLAWPPHRACPAPYEKIKRTRPRRKQRLFNRY